MVIQPWTASTKDAVGARAIRLGVATRGASIHRGGSLVRLDEEATAMPAVYTTITRLAAATS